MKKLVKILISIIALLIAGIIAIIIITYGLISNNPANRAKKNAFKYMEEKYGEIFTYSAPYGDSMSGTHEFFVTCESIPDKRILVQVENYKKDNPIYKDNYIAVKYEEKTRELIGSCANLYDVNANIFYTARKTGLCESLSKDASFEEFIASASKETLKDNFPPMTIMIEIKKSEFKNRKQIEQICQKIADVSGYINMNIAIAVVQDEFFCTMDRSELNSRVGNFLYNSNHTIFESYANVYIRKDDVCFDWHDDV